MARHQTYLEETEVWLWSGVQSPFPLLQKTEDTSSCKDHWLDIEDQTMYCARYQRGGNNLKSEFVIWTVVIMAAWLT